MACTVGVLALLQACNRYPRDPEVEALGDTQAPMRLLTGAQQITDVGSQMELVNNDNLLAEPGETVSVNGLFLEWSGTVPRTLAMRAVPVREASCIAAVGPSPAPVSVPAVGAPTTVPIGPVLLSVAPSPCEGGVARFNLEVTFVETEEAFLLPVSFEVHPRESAMSVQSVAVLDSATGDGNGVLSAGESSILAINVRNDGVSTLRNVELSIDSTVTRTCINAISTGPVGQRPAPVDLFPGQVTALGGGLLTVTVDATCSDGDRLEAGFIARDSAGTEFKLNYQVKLQ